MVKFRITYTKKSSKIVNAQDREEARYKFNREDVYGEKEIYSIEEVKE